MRKEYLFIGALVLIAGLLFGFGSRAGFAVQQALRGEPHGGTSDRTAFTASISDALRGPQSDLAGKTVPVYSQYPLNLKHELTIAAGGKDGIAPGSVALAEGFLVGVVTKVSERTAVVQTVFDSRFQVPVRIGNSGTDALLKGGNNPALTLIPAAGAVGENDVVYSAAAGMPYGMPLGVLRGLRDATDKVFREASLVTPYNPALLEHLTIVPAAT